MSLKINTPTANEYAATLSSKWTVRKDFNMDNIEQTCVAHGKKVRCSSLSPVGEKQVITPCKAIAATRGRKNRRKYPNSVGVQHLSFMLRLSQKEKNLTAKGAKGLRKERNIFILRHLFFATFAKNLSVFAVKKTFETTSKDIKNQQLIKLYSNEMKIANEKNNPILSCRNYFANCHCPSRF